MVILREKHYAKKYPLFILLLWGIHTITEFCIIYPIVELFIGWLIQGKEIWLIYVLPAPRSAVTHTGSFNDTT